MEKKQDRAQDASVAPARSSRAEPVSPAHSVRNPKLSAIAEQWFDAKLNEEAGSHIDDSLFDAKSAELPALGKLKAILAKCIVPGCDVHYVTRELTILQHVQRSTKMPADFSDARDYLEHSASDVVAVLVFDTGSYLLSLDGSLTRLR